MDSYLVMKAESMRTDNNDVKPIPVHNAHIHKKIKCCIINAWPVVGDAL